MMRRCGKSEVDLGALSADSRQLLNGIVLLAVAAVLTGIWGEIIPALGILENVNLWDQAALVDGAQQIVPVT